mmetsp:Transcript_65337/g.75989  ORF Transcript_65337/g.75989 Transcript_65337/m.75989 type:complete len:160 (+) Transcript_65337:2-481(+)
MKSALKKTETTFVKTANLSVTFANETEEVKDAETDKEVMLNCYRVRGAEALDEARRLSDQKRYEEARKVLSDFKEELLGSQWKAEESVKGLIEEFEAVLKQIRPEYYEAQGKKSLISKATTHMCQKSSPADTYSHSYSNTVQTQMVQASISRKTATTTK